MENYYQIERIANQYKQLLKLRDDLIPDFITEIWLLLKDRTHMTDAYVLNTMKFQRFNKNNPVYKKLFKYYDYHSDYEVDINSDINGDDY